MACHMRRYVLSLNMYHILIETAFLNRDMSNYVQEKLMYALK
jgi:hypothetical protein